MCIRDRHPRDAIVRVTATAVCGSDLHIYNGLVPQLRTMTLGHEFMGTVEAVGSRVADLQPGDRERLVYGQSITDPCMGWDTTAAVLDELAAAVRARRASVASGHAQDVLSDVGQHQIVGDGRHQE